MCSLASIGVNDYLASCKASVSVWSSDDEFSRWIHVVLYVVAKEFKHFFVCYLCLCPWDKDIDDVFAYLCKHSVVVGKFVVLC